MRHFLLGVGYVSGTMSTTPFLEVAVHDLGSDPTLTALCVCYELGVWRYDGFVQHLFEWLPEFALNYSERQSFTDATSVGLLRRAAAVVYRSQKYARRGEFGELMLHVAVRQVFDSEPAISKIYFKDSSNDTVKGFDAVHVVRADDGLELWLGEVKFYKDAKKAIADVSAELTEHLAADYLRREFLLIENKIDDAWPHAADLRSLINSNTSLDQVFKRLVIPVLFTYESSAVASSTAHDDEYATAFESEVRALYQEFATKIGKIPVQIRLFMIPLANKDHLVTALDAKLKTWQSI